LEPIVGCHPQETTNNQVGQLEKRKIHWLGVFWGVLGVGRGKGREEPCMALRTLFISCVRKVGKYNKEFFSF
jgi:hypothetical protein